MHCVLIADLAALVSQHGPAILYGRETVPPESVSQYWATSRNRLELWHQTIARYRKTEQVGDFSAMRAWWKDHISVVEEVLVTEMLTRVIATMAAGWDRAHSVDEVSPVTHAVYLNHLEVRNRIQQLMLFGRGNSVQDTVRLNRLRQGVERWTDSLVGRLCCQNLESTKPPRGDCQETNPGNKTQGMIHYAFNPTRALEYAFEARSNQCGRGRDLSAWLMNASMHDTLRRRTSSESGLPEANRAVAGSVMLMLRPDLFDSVGALKSLWLHRLQVGADRTDRVLDELTAPDINQASTANAIEMSGEPYFERWYM